MASGPAGGKVRKELRWGVGGLDGAQPAVDRSRTGTVEGNASVAEIVDALKRALDELKDAPEGTLDHLWIYLDEPSSA